ncbi:hypothetical protein OEA41_001350 [Lepraria neglecta]|uniref:Uncharacterized protein n=1 Tax=Lepraria neglecta TaxID=209136 RepID=A0AAE0DLF6_9LECA|nr:hypothetical protein OEA41_001350 [Lepraria neglecta]
MVQVEGIALPQAVSIVAVIGAGPSGLATARRLLEAGLNVTVFERKRKTGGTCFKRWFVTHKVIVEYLQQFSKDTQVEKNTKYNTNVINLEKKGTGWLVIATEALHPSGKKVARGSFPTERKSTAFLSHLKISITYNSFSFSMRSWCA